MLLDIIFIIYLAIIVFALACGAIRYQRLHTASRVMIILLVCTLISECVADIFAHKYHNNMVVYHIYAPVQFFLVSLYFNYSIEAFRRKYTGWYIGIAGIVVAILNSAFLQPVDTLNSHYLLFSGFVIISMSLYAFYTILENDDAGVFNNPHFWFSFILLFFWSTTYINWSLYRILSEKMLEMIPFISTALLSIGVITYFGFGLVFLFYPKKT